MTLNHLLVKLLVNLHDTLNAPPSFHLINLVFCPVVLLSSSASLIVSCVCPMFTPLRQMPRPPWARLCWRFGLSTAAWWFFYSSTFLRNSLEICQYTYSVTFKPLCCPLAPILSTLLQTISPSLIPTTHLPHLGPFPPHLKWPGLHRSPLGLL